MRQTMPSSHEAFCNLFRSMRTSEPQKVLYTFLSTECNFTRQSYIIKAKCICAYKMPFEAFLYLRLKSLLKQQVTKICFQLNEPELNKFDSDGCGAKVI